MAGSWTVPLADEAATARLGEALAIALRPGDWVALHGDLGAGKTTLARALLRSFSGKPSLDVPSPTFTLVQPYEGEGFRFPIAHADLYRVREAAELDELGLDEVAVTGAVLVEWPERAGDRLPAARIDVALTGTGPSRQAVLSSADPAIAARIERLVSLRRFLDGTDYAERRRLFLQGDASPRGYERLVGPSGESVILLNANAMPDRPASPERHAYMAATHLAPNEDLAPLLAISAELGRAGLSVPTVYAASLTDAVAVIEDLGRAYIQENGTPIPERYAVATDVLAAMHARDWPTIAEGPFGARHAVPFYSRRAMEIEVALFVQQFLSRLGGASEEAVAAFRRAWDAPFALLEATPRTWSLYDYHSPNLHWLGDRRGLARIGLIDVQDTRFGPAAYDLVSLAQDARVDVAEALEEELKARYLAAREAAPGFDRAAFLAAYAICGAERATRILGVFARLAAQDGKPHYLRHIPRISGYLDRCLRHPILDGLRAWYETHAPGERRVAFRA